MTRAEALAEARMYADDPAQIAAIAEAMLRWGKRDGTAGRMHSAARPAATHWVGRWVPRPNYNDRAYDGRELLEMGVGDSYEAAFADADRRAVRTHTLWTLAATFPHRQARIRHCPCQRMTSGHEFKIGGLWKCRACADEAYDRRAVKP